MRKTILRNMVLLTVLTVIVTSILILLATYQVFNDKTRTQLRDHGSFLLNLVHEGYRLEELVESRAVQESSARITLIAADGQVLWDNRADPATMDNHLLREEVQAALTHGEADSLRLSSTLGTQTFYYAVALANGAVLRFATTTDSVVFTLYRLLSFIAGIVVVVVIVAIVVASRLVDVILRPINRIDLDRPLESDAYDELSPLLRRIARQNRAIAQQINELKEKQAEFDAITRNMAEGLIILNEDGHIMRVNPSALRILGHADLQEQGFVGRSVLTLTRDIALQEAIHTGLSGQGGDVVIPWHGKVFQVYVNPVYDKHVRGLVVILIDITQKNEMEQMRREFSANVSHELKTPLTVISNYAELMKNAMANPEKIRPFAQHIYDETQRMTALVNDILKLSRLDEEEQMQCAEAVDLRLLAVEVVDSLRPLAQERQIAMDVTGESATVLGNRAILFDMLYNLCDNAIKYNRSCGGQVQIDCTRDGDVVTLKVTDNGTGIPLTYQDRVFERFYRVDQSHSKRTGGTGLGLAIVKHAAEYHHAVISLDSVENKGTTISIAFSHYEAINRYDEVTAQRQSVRPRA